MLRKRAGIRTGRILFRQALPRSDCLHRKPSARGSPDKGSPGAGGAPPCLIPQRPHTHVHRRTRAAATHEHVHTYTGARAPTGCVALGQGQGPGGAAGDTVSSPRMETPDSRQTGPGVQAIRLPTEPALGTPAGPRSRENARPDLYSPGSAWAARAACPALPSRAPPHPAPGLPLAVAVASLLSAPPTAHLPSSVGCGLRIPRGLAGERQPGGGDDRQMDGKRSQ